MELRGMRDLDLIEQKGKGRATYYVPGKELQLNAQISGLTDTVSRLSDTAKPLTDGVTRVTDRVQQVINTSSLPPIPPTLFEILNALGKRSNDKQLVQEAILELCKWHPLRLSEISEILDRSPNYILNEYLNSLRVTGRLVYTFPDMPNHPKQAYKTAEKEDI